MLEDTLRSANEINTITLTVSCQWRVRVSITSLALLGPDISTLNGPILRCNQPFYADLDFRLVEHLVLGTAGDVSNQIFITWV